MREKKSRVRTRARWIRRRRVANGVAAVVGGRVTPKCLSSDADDNGGRNCVASGSQEAHRRGFRNTRPGPTRGQRRDVRDHRDTYYDNDMNMDAFASPRHLPPIDRTREPVDDLRLGEREILSHGIIIR